MGKSGATLDQRIFRGEPEALQIFIQQSLGRLALIAGFRMPVELQRYVRIHQVLQAAQASMIRRQREFTAGGRRPGFLWLREVLLQTIERLTRRFTLCSNSTPLDSEKHWPRLTVLDREILFLRHYEELTNEEAAIVTGISPQGLSIRYVQILHQIAQSTDRAAKSAPLPKETAYACG